MQYKRLLVISHNCLSQTGSNGRTLSNLLCGWPKESLAQLYIHNEKPDMGICEAYCCITDRMVLRSIFLRQSAGSFSEEIKSLPLDVQHTRKKQRKNSLLYLVRNAVWNSRLWKRKALNNWLSAFCPEIVLIQAGDAGFLFKLALQITDRFHSRLVVFNTEGYYFKTKTYLQDNRFTALFYSRLNKRFRKEYDALIKKSNATVYNCELLRDDYESVFHNNGQVIPNSSGFTAEPVYQPKERKIVYAGGLSLNRHQSLIQLANAVHEMDDSLVIDTYGACQDKQAEQGLLACKGIRYHGFMGYEELKTELRKAQYLVHIESFDAFYREDLKYAFSTKIADSLAAGSCLIVYAPDNMAVSRYLRDKDAAILITDPAELKDKLYCALFNPEVYNRVSMNGRRLAIQNHDLATNSCLFQAMLISKGDK